MKRTRGRWTSSRALLGLLAFAPGCGGGKNTDSGRCTTCDCVEHPELKSRWPEDGATGVYHRTRMYAIVDDDADVERALACTDATGAEVPGTSTYDPDEGMITFTPDSPLLPETTYTLTRTTDGCEADAATFTTSAIGTPVSDLQTLVGRTWRMRLGDGRPPPERNGLQAVLDQIAEDLLIHALSADGSTLTVLVASSESGTGAGQDLCVPTIEVDLDLAENPFATGAVPAGYAPLSGEAVPTYGGQVQGSFSADGAVLAGIDLTMVLDMDAAGQILGDPQLCGTLQKVGVFCEPCPSGAGNCLNFNTWGVDGAEDTGASVVARTEADVANDPSCP